MSLSSRKLIVSFCSLCQIESYTYHTVNWTQFPANEMRPGPHLFAATREHLITFAENVIQEQVSPGSSFFLCCWTKCLVSLAGTKPRTSTWDSMGKKQNKTKQKRTREVKAVILYVFFTFIYVWELTVDTSHLLPVIYGAWWSYLFNIQCVLQICFLFVNVCRV